jgi:hypothetical protein
VLTDQVGHPVATPDQFTYDREVRMHVAGRRGGDDCDVHPTSLSAPSTQLRRALRSGFAPLPIAVSAVEGTVTICRAQRSIEPLDQVTTELARLGRDSPAVGETYVWPIACVAHCRRHPEIGWS